MSEIEVHFTHFTEDVTTVSVSLSRAPLTPAMADMFPDQKLLEFAKIQQFKLEFIPPKERTTWLPNLLGKSEVPGCKIQFWD